MVSTVFLSSFLLFIVQPMIAKGMLAQFGGSSAVWVTSLVFFQTMLLAGYAYADRLIAWSSAKARRNVHLLALLVSAAFMPLMPGAPAFAALPSLPPALQVVATLALTLGLPYLLLASTGPLLQALHHARYRTQNVYRLYSISNLASLGGLLAYPFTIERLWPVDVQLTAWSAFFTIFIVINGLTVWRFSAACEGAEPDHSTTAESEGGDAPAAPALRQKLTWIALAALGSALLVTTTAHITQNVASIPLLWVLPLGLYLFSFVVTFEHDRWYSHRIIIVPIVFAPFLMMLTAYSEAHRLTFPVLLTLNTLGMFVCCWFIHGELSQRRPAPAYLTGFYLYLSAGGAIGGFASSLLAPSVLDGFYEHRILLMMVALLALLLLRRYCSRNAFSYGIYAMLTGLTLVTLALGGVSLRNDSKDRVVTMRNFYATTTVKEVDYQDGSVVRTLYNGTIWHGSQHMAPESLQQRAGDYYGPHSGVGVLLNELASGPALHVGVIGLGAGVLASYVRPEDQYTFFEINPQSIAVAKEQFAYLKNARAHVNIVEGDARIQLTRSRDLNQRYQFNVLAVDAFSGDAIPVHLLTREAISLYFDHLRPDGVLGIHISNKYLDLREPVAASAAALGYTAIEWSSQKELEPYEYSSTWILLTRSPDAHRNMRWLREGRLLAASGARNSGWTDSYNNLIDTLVLRRDTR